MTTERWTDDMLDRFASTMTSTLTNLTDLTEQNTRSILRIEQTVERLAEVVEIHQQNMEMVIGRIDEMQSEVRGLQTENRRILDQLINRDNGNPS
jgi:methyl-accepting chemotaxis protein